VVASSSEDGLALVGNRITGNRLDGLDEEVLSSISNEILRYREQKLLQILKTPKTSGTWQLSSETNRKIIEEQLSSIMSLKLEPEARRVMLYKFLQLHPGAYYSYKVNNLLASDNQVAPVYSP